MAGMMFESHAFASMQLHEIRVMFLGDPGKSRILAQLLHEGEEPWDDKNAPTPGFTIARKELDVENRKVKVNFWAFGNDDLPPSMYRLFMTERTLYVVVLDARESGLNDRARYWLNNIRGCAKDAPVLLVLDQTDELFQEEVDEASFQSLYPNLRRVLRLTSQKDDHSFTDALLTEIRLTHWLDDFWNVSWIDVRKTLYWLKEDYISISEFRKLCQTHHVSADQEKLLQWLNDLGACFGSFEMGDRIVLRPRWLVNALYLIMDHVRTNTRNGLVSRQAIHELLLHASDPSGTRYLWEEERAYILYVMERYYLSLALLGNRELFPDYCMTDPEPVVGEYENDEEVLEFRMEFAYLPRNVVYRLMAERRQELDTANVWRNGARFVQPDTGLSAVIIGRGNTLHFFIRHTNAKHMPSTYLRQLKASADRIWIRMGLRETASLVVYKEGGISETYSYDMLMDMLKNGAQTIYSRRRRRTVPITDILNQNAAERKRKRQTNELLREIAKACVELQGNRSIFRMTEYERNDYLRSLLRLKYVVKDQHKIGVNKYGVMVGAPHLQIYDQSDHLLTFLEAVIISSNNSSVRLWDQHLSILLNRHDPAECSAFFLVSYVHCRPTDYEALWGRFSDHMRWYSPERCEQVENSYQELKEFGQERQFLRVGWCNYHVDGRTVTVYHLFVGFVEADSTATSSTNNALNSLQQRLRELREKGGEPPVEKPEQKKPAEPTPPAEETALLEYRVVLLGDSEAGKSLILARLKDPRMDPAAFSGDTTAGIDIYSRIEDIGGRRVRVNYWDFGGQEILHSMHRMFLSNQTLYVIVLNTRNDNQDAQAGFWIRYVQTYAPGAPLLLVMNKIDQNPRATLNLPVLCRQLNRKLDPADLLKLCAVEKDPKAFAGAFTEKLMERIRQSIHGAREFTATQAKIRDLVEEKKKKCQVISCDDFLDICDDAGLKEQREQEALMNRFHEAGIMVFFGEGKPMLLNPEWITTAIYKVLEKRDEIAGNGIVPHTKLRKLFRRELGDAYSSDDAEAVLKVMRAYGMSFPCEEAVPGVSGSENKEFIPMLCQREEPPQIEDLTLADGTIELQMIFEYLPGGVFHQLMVDHQDILDKEHAWLSGAIFRSGGDYAIVRRDGNVLSIYVHHRHKVEAANWLFALAEQVKVIAKRTKYRAEIYEMRIGFRIADVMEYFDYDRLLSAKACQLHYVASKVNRQPVAVRDILEQDDRSAERDRNELLRLTLVGCMDLQKDEVFWNTDENTKNRQLARTLRQRFTVLDQTQGGLSESGSSSGELDIEIRKGKDMPIAILEALKTTSIRTKNWREHLDKLMDNYNTSGLRYLILTSYVGGPKHLFGKKCAEAAAEWKQEPESFQGCLENFDTVLLNDRPELVHITRADYIRNHFRVSLYHFMVHISENKTAKQS